MGEYGDDVAFGEFVGEAADVDPGGVAPVGVPGGGERLGEGLVWVERKPEGWRVAYDAGVKLFLVETFDLADVVHGRRFGLRGALREVR